MKPIRRQGFEFVTVVPAGAKILEPIVDQYFKLAISDNIMRMMKRADYYEARRYLRLAERAIAASIRAAGSPTILRPGLPPR